MLTKSPLYTAFLCLFFITALHTPLEPAHANENFRQQLLQASDKKAGGAYVRTRFLKSMKKPFNGSGKKVLLIGDSHAQDFYNVIRENAFLRNAQISTHYVPTRCQMYIGQQPQTDFIDPRDHQLCKKSDTLQSALPMIKQADIIILAANWRKWAAQRLPTSIRHLNLNSRQKLVVIGRKSFGRINARSYLRMQPDQLRDLRNPVDSKQVGINQLMRNTLPKNVFVDQQQQVCKNQKTCPIFTSKLELISFDGGHYTQAGARYAGRKLLQHPILRRL